MAGELISREALDRIIRRAAELQAHERDIGEGMTRDDLLALGKDVGIPSHYLQRALLEEQTRSPLVAADDTWGWLAGPGWLGAERVVQGERGGVESAVAALLEGEESLQVRRRYSDRLTWEPKRGALASIQRALNPGGKRYILTRAGEVTSQVTPLEPGFCHVRLLADVRNQRSARMGGAAATVTVGAAGVMVATALGVVLPLALAPAALLLAAVPILRAHRGQNEQVQTALEQVLDRLEHGGTKPERLLAAPRQSAFVRIAAEIKKTIDQL